MQLSHGHRAQDWQLTAALAPHGELPPLFPPLLSGGGVHSPGAKRAPGAQARLREGGELLSYPLSLFPQPVRPSEASFPPTHPRTSIEILTPRHRTPQHRAVFGTLEPEPLKR